RRHLPPFPTRRSSDLPPPRTRTPGPTPPPPTRGPPCRRTGGTGHRASSRRRPPPGPGRGWSTRAGTGHAPPPPAGRSGSGRAGRPGSVERAWRRVCSSSRCITYRHACMLLIVSAVSSLVGVHDVPESVRALTTFDEPDYVDLFTVTMPRATDWSAEEWARAVLEQTEVARRDARS